MARLVPALLLASLVGCASAPPAAPPPAAPAAPPAPATQPEHVDGATAKKLVGSGARLVDVRTPEEYAAGHVEGAENVPVDTIATHDFGAKETPLVVYCGSGKRSARAAAALRARGYTHVNDLGGMSRWNE